MTFVLPFSLFAAIYVGSGVAIKQALDADTPRQKLAFIASPAAEEWKNAINTNGNFQIMPDLSPKTWEERLKSGKDSLSFVVELQAEADGSVSEVQIWYDGTRINGATRLKEAFYRYQQRQFAQKLRLAQPDAPAIRPADIIAEDFRGMNERLRPIMDILLGVLGSTLGLFVLLSLTWTGRHVAIRRLVIAPKHGIWTNWLTHGLTEGRLRFYSFLIVWLSTYLAAIWIVGGAYAASLLPYGDDSAIAVRFLGAFLTPKFYLQAAIHVIPLSLVLAALWLRITAGAEASSYRAMRRGNVLYIVVSIGSLLGIIGTIIQIEWLIYVPIFGTFALFYGLVKAKITVLALLAYWAVHLLLAAWLYWASGAHFFQLIQRKKA